MPIFQSTLPYGSDILLILLIICSLRYFNPRSLTGATLTPVYLNDVLHIYFNPRSLTGATRTIAVFFITVNISIHAPLRERHPTDSTDYLFPTVFQSTLPYGSDANACVPKRCTAYLFQSTLPYGSDKDNSRILHNGQYFNPRSLTGATAYHTRRMCRRIFQSTLPYGSDISTQYLNFVTVISIHAPLRERQK